MRHVWLLAVVALLLVACAGQVEFSEEYVPPEDTPAVSDSIEQLPMEIVTESNTTVEETGDDEPVVLVPVIVDHIDVYGSEFSNTYYMNRFSAFLLGNPDPEKIEVVTAFNRHGGTLTYNDSFGCRDITRIQRSRLSGFSSADTGNLTEICFGAPTTLQVQSRINITIRYASETVFDEVIVMPQFFNKNYYTVYERE